MTDKLEEPFPGCLYASYCYQSGAISSDIMSTINEMMHFWRQRLCEKIDAIVSINPPRIPIENHQVADHLLTTFEGAFILSRIMKEPRLASQQLIQCRNYIELLFTPAP
jgi:TetR/AcrR family transcriptional repressor of nem operon